MDLVCTSCGERFPDRPGRWRCRCGGTLDVDYSPSFSPEDVVAGDHTMWRYRSALPVDYSDRVSLGEGMTPLFRQRMEDSSVLIKLEYLSPTGSFKDRGAAVMMSRLREQGATEVVEDSSGNAALSVAAYSARAGIKSRIFIPRSASERAPLLQLLGAEVVVEATRKAASDSALRAATEGGVIYASHVWNPYFIQGVKTFAYEVCEQMEWDAPDAVVLPVGNGTLFLGAYRGFRELLDNGVIGHMPALVAVQAASCAPIYHGWKRGSDTYADIREMKSLASGIAIKEPPRASEIIAAVKGTDGKFITVSEAEIIAAVKEWHRMGVAVEPTGAAGLAGLKKYISENRDITVVGSATGTSIKSAGGKLDIFL